MRAARANLAQRVKFQDPGPDPLADDASASFNLPSRDGETIEEPTGALLPPFGPDELSILCESDAEVPSPAIAEVEAPAPAAAEANDLGPYGDADEEVDEVARTRWAMDVIQQCIKNRHARQSFAAVVRKAQEMFMTPEAMDAGASGGIYYTKAALMVRVTLRNDPVVESALAYAWQRVVHAEMNIRYASREHLIAFRAGGRMGSGQLVLSRAAYATMIRKLYLLLKDDDRDAKINPAECLKSIQEDWPKDSVGQSEMSESAFQSCWFELADLVVEGLRAEEYAVWLADAADAITMWRGGAAAAAAERGAAAEGDDEEHWLGWRCDEHFLDRGSCHTSGRTPDYGQALFS